LSISLLPIPALELSMLSVLFNPPLALHFTGKDTNKPCFGSLSSSDTATLAVDSQSGPRILRSRINQFVPLLSSIVGPPHERTFQLFGIHAVEALMILHTLHLGRDIEQEIPVFFFNMQRTADLCVSNVCQADK
jgi:hypothetical protein